MVEQSYLFAVDEAEKIVAAMATDGTKVQFLAAASPDEPVKDIEDSLTGLLERGVPEDLTPLEYIGGTFHFMITDGFEFDSFEAAATAAKEQFDRGAVADDFAIE